MGVIIFFKIKTNKYLNKEIQNGMQTKHLSKMKDNNTKKTTTQYKNTTVGCIYTEPRQKEYNQKWYQQQRFMIQKDK